MNEPKIAYRDTWPADGSIRADAELGRAWRRVIAGAHPMPVVVTASGIGVCATVVALRKGDDLDTDWQPDLLTALTVLADALETAAAR